MNSEQDKQPLPVEDRALAKQRADAFRSAAQAERSALAQWIDFFLSNKKWWLAPLVLVLLLLGLLFVLSGTVAASFIYTLF